MGYDFFAKYKKDDDYIFTTQCMYQYEPIFKEILNNNQGIYYFNGRVTKKKIQDFRKFIDEFKNNEASYNLDYKQFQGYVGNITYCKLIQDFEKIYDLMSIGKCKYFSIC